MLMHMESDFIRIHISVLSQHTNLLYYNNFETKKLADATGGSTHLVSTVFDALFFVSVTYVL